METKDLQSQSAVRLVMQQYSNQILGPLINLAVFGLIYAKYAEAGMIYTYFSRHLHTLLTVFNIFRHN